MNRAAFGVCLIFGICFWGVGIAWAVLGGDDDPFDNEPGEADGAFKVLSFQGLGIFLCSLGLAGYVAVEVFGAPAWAASLLGAGLGFFFLYLKKGLMGAAKKLESKPMDPEALLGAAAVTLSSVNKQLNTGSVHILFRGGLAEFPAVAKKEIAPRVAVRVIGYMADGTLVVEER